MKLGITSSPYLNKYGIEEGAKKMRQHGYSCIDYQGFVNINGKILSMSEAEREKELTANLRRIINPIAMVVHRFPHKCFPCRSGEFGFDLERGDWTAPFGTGKVADITFTYNLVVTNDMSRCSGSLSFNASGGAYKLKKKGTSFVSVYEADSNATYRTEFPFSSYCSYKDSGDYGAVRVAEDDEYLVFRTRVVKDEKGNIVSANYGKIYGAIRTVGFFGATAIYFNPTPNDVNMEEKQ
jgi:hypothetical protein